MNITCPCCHAKYSLDAALETDAAAELQLLLADSPQLARLIVSYLGLFRSKNRALSFDRAAKLARDLVSLQADPRALAAALTQTIESIRQKRDTGQVKPLANHNYLRRVLENTALLPQEMQAMAPQRPTSKTYLADQVLDAWGGDDWLRVQIAHGIKALFAMPLMLKPEAEVIDRTASLWERELRSVRCEIQAIDGPRVEQGFGGLISHVKGKFPEPSEILAYLPRRKDRSKLPEPELTEEDYSKGRDAIKKARESIFKP